MDVVVVGAAAQASADGGARAIDQGLLAASAERSAEADGNAAQNSGIKVLLQRNRNEVRTEWRPDRASVEVAMVASSADTV